MEMPEFWKPGQPRWKAILLAPLGILFGLITTIRMGRRGKWAGVPVISIGNFTAGGAGKTPTVLAIADRLCAQGERPFILTRGYGGREKGPVMVDPAHHGAADVGDEALMMGQRQHVVVARDRAAGAKLAETMGATCLILDDGLQNPALEKDVSIAVIDGGFGFGNGMIMPAGPMRGPVVSAASLLSGILLVSEDRTNALSQVPPSIPVHGARIVPDEASVEGVRGKRVFAFCGIGRPQKFYDSLIAAGAVLVGNRDFPDHHAFSNAEAHALLAAAASNGAMLVTTEKDRMRLAGSSALAELAEATTVFQVRYDLDETLHAAIAEGVAAARIKLAERG
jgi:tetraacyldisaccharide 4'-kinase